MSPKFPQKQEYDLTEVLRYGIVPTSSHITGMSMII